MNMRRLGGGAMLCIVLISALVTGSIEGKRKTLESFLGNGIGWVYPEIDEDMAEKVWMNCKQELKDLIGSVHDADLYLDAKKPEMSSELGLRRKRRMQKAINSLSPQVKVTLLFVCLSRNDLQDGKYKSWIVKYQELFSGSPDARRRQLRGKGRVNSLNPPAEDENPDLSQANPTQNESPPGDPSPPVRNPRRSSAPKQPPAENPAKGSPKTRAPTAETPDTEDSDQKQSPPPVASPRQKAPPPTVDPPPGDPPPPVDPPTPAPLPKRPDPPPTPPPRRSYPPPSPLVDPPPPPQSDPPPPPQSDPPSPPQSDPPQPAPSHKTQEDTDSKKKTIIIAVGSGIIGALLFAGLLICCVRHKRDRMGPRNGQKDDRPLLNSCLSDFSAGSSSKSQSVGNSSGKHFGINGGKHRLNVSHHLSGLSNGGEPGVADRPSNADSGFASPPPRTPIKPPAPPPPPPPKPASRAPPPPAPRAPAPPALKAGRPPPPAMKGAPLPIGHNRGASNSSFGDESDSEAPKAKLKPFFWDKVLASPDHSMVWHEIKEGSFQFNEEMMESLFGYSAVEKSTNERRKDAHAFERPQYIQIIDSKKSQNLSILLRALNVTTDEVCDALRQGTELPQELIYTLIKMSPTPDEELKLRLYNGDSSQLGPAERFLKNLVEIPFAFRRLETLLFMCNQKEEVSNIKESLVTLEVACNKLRKSRLFLKLLEAVLKTGNRMNDGTYRGGAQAFKLDTLLKLSDVKGADGKTTLLHFVVQEIIRSEGVRSARTAKESKSSSSITSEDFAQDSSQETPEYFRNLGLDAVSGLSTELQDVKRAAVIDADALNSTSTKISHALLKAKDFLNNEMTSLEEDSGFHQTLAKFVEQSEAEIPFLLEEEKRIMALVKLTADYFHGNSGKDEGLRLFLIVRDFLLILDKTCKEVKNAETKHTGAQRKETSNESSSEDASQKHITDFRQRLFPLISDKSMNDNDTDSDYES